MRGGPGGHARGPRSGREARRRAELLLADPLVAFTVASVDAVEPFAAVEPVDAFATVDAVDAVVAFEPLPPLEPLLPVRPFLTVEPLRRRVEPG